MCPVAPDVLGRTANSGVAHLASAFEVGISGRDLSESDGGACGGGIDCSFCCLEVSLRLFVRNLNDFDLASIPGMMGFKSASECQVRNAKKSNIRTSMGSGQTNGQLYRAKGEVEVANSQWVG